MGSFQRGFVSDPIRVFCTYSVFQISSQTFNVTHDWIQDTESLLLCAVQL